MLVFAGQGSSQPLQQNDATNHELQQQVLAILDRLDQTVPADMQVLLLDPLALDSLAQHYAHALSQQQGALDAAAMVLLIQGGLEANLVLRASPQYPDLMEEVRIDVAEILDDLGLMQPMGACVHDEFELLPEAGVLAGPACLLIKLAGPAILIATIVLSILSPYAIEAAKIALYLDDNADEIGDDWGDYWLDVSDETSLIDDWDQDELSNIKEFRWELYPACAGALPDDPKTQLVDESLLTSDNCTDYDHDNWMDGPEVAYWNNPANDAFLTAEGITFLDPDRHFNTDDDEIPNIRDPDSDNDRLLDGDEVNIYGTYPEFADSDCAMTALECTLSSDTTYWDQARLGQPGSGDHINDADELAYWNSVDPDAWRTDWDGDGIWNNLLDPDSDDDGVLDGDEIRAGTDPSSPDDGPAATAAWNDPTNEDLDELHPVNQAYLENKSARAVAALNETANGNETALLDFVADLADEALDLVWEQEALDPVRPFVERVPFVQEVREAPAIIRNPRAPVEGVLDYVDRGIGILEPALMESIESGSPQPLLNATDQVGPYVADAPLVGQALPAPVREELQEFSVPTPEEIIAGVEDLQESPTTPIAEIQDRVRSLLPTTTPMPTFTADTLLATDLVEVYETMTTVSQETGTPHAATVSDVPHYTVLVNHTGTLTIESPLQIGKPTSIHVDDDPSTGDPGGFDVEVELTLDAPADPFKPGLPVLPGFRITKLESAESYEASLHAFVQIPGEETVAVLGVNQHASVLNTANTAHADLPDDVWLRLTDYKPATEGDASTAAGLNETRIGFAIQSLAPEARPVLVQGGLVPFDVADLEKEPLPGEDHSIGARLSAIPQRVALNLHDVGSVLDVSWRASQVLDVEAVVADQSNEEGLRQELVAKGLPGSVDFVKQDLGNETRITYDANAVMPSFWFYSRHEQSNQAPVNRVHVNATSIPASLALDVLRDEDHYSFTASQALGFAHVQLSPGSAPCRSVVSENFLVHEPGACTALNVTGLQDVVVDYASGVEASWTRSTGAGDLAVSVAGKKPFLLDASVWPATGQFELQDAMEGGTSVSWTGSAGIPVLHVSGDNRDDLGGALYRFDVTDLPASLEGRMDGSQRSLDLDASDRFSIDFAYTEKAHNNTLQLSSDFVAIDTKDGLAASGSIQGVKSVHVDLASGDLLHVAADVSTPSPLRVVYRGTDGAVDAYLSNVPEQVRFDYERVLEAQGAAVVQDTRRLSYNATAPVTLATAEGVLDGAFFDFRFEDLPTELVLDADNINHRWVAAANAPVGLIDVTYVENQGSYQRPTSGDYAVFYNEPVQSPGMDPATIAYAARLTGFTSAEVWARGGEFHVESVWAAPRPFTLRYGEGLDYAHLEVDQLPAHLNVTYAPGNLDYDASHAVGVLDVDAHLESLKEGALKLKVHAEDVPTQLDAQWTRGDVTSAHITHNGITPVQNVSVQHWDLRDSASLGKVPYLELEAASVPDDVELEYVKANNRITLDATHGGAPATLVEPRFWSVPTGTTSVDEPVASEYVFIQQAANNEDVILVDLDGVQSIDALLSPPTGELGWFRATKTPGSSLHVELRNPAVDATTRLLAANTPSEVDVSFRIDQASVGDTSTLEGLDVRWRANAAIQDAFLQFESVNQQGTVKRAAFSSPSIPTSLDARYVADELLWFDASAPVTLNGTYASKGFEAYPERSGRDYAFLHQSAGGDPVLGVDLTGLNNVTVDLVSKTAHMDRATTRDVEVGVETGTLSLSLAVDDPAPVMDAAWQQSDGRLLDYEASAAVAKLVFSLNDEEKGVIVQAKATGVPLAVLVEAAKGAPFQVLTPLGGSIGDAFIEVGLDGTGLVPVLPWAEGAVVVQNETRDVARATARLVGLEELRVRGESNATRKTFDVHADLQRSASLAGAPFGIRIETPQNTTQATGVGLPEDVSLDVVKREGLDFLLDWTASGVVQDVVVEISTNGVVSNHVSAPELPASVFLEAAPDATGSALTYAASSRAPSIVAKLQVNGTQVNLDAVDVPTGMTGHVRGDFKEGRLDAPLVAGQVELSFHPLQGIPLEFVSPADEYVHMDLTEATGKRGHMVVEHLESASWIFDNAIKSYGVHLERSQASVGHSVEARVQLDDGLLVIDAVDVPTSLRFGVDLNATLGVSENPLLSFVEPEDFLAAWWDSLSSASSLSRVDVRFTPVTASGLRVNVTATEVPEFLVLHASRLGDGGWNGTYGAGGRLGSLVADVEYKDTRIHVDLEDAPSNLAFMVSGDKRTGLVEVPVGVGFGKLDVAVHPRNQDPPSLPVTMDVQSSLVIDAKTEGETAVAASFPAGVDVQRAQWSKPVDSEEVQVVLERNPLASKPSFGLLGEFADFTLSGTLSELPSLIQYESLGGGHHNATIKGSAGDAAVHVVSGSGVFWVNATGLPDWMHAVADIQEGGNVAVDYDASAGLPWLGIEGTHNGTRFDAEVEGVPAAFQVRNHASTSNGVGNTVGNLTLPAGGQIGRIEAALYPDGGVSLVPVDENVLQLQPTKDAAGAWVDAVYLEVSDVVGASWNMTKTVEPTCTDDDRFDATFTADFAATTDLRVLSEGDCDKYMDIDATRVPASIAVTVQEGLIQYDVAAGANTENILAYVEGFSGEGPDNRAIESVDLWINDLVGPVTFRTAPPEDNGGRSLVRILGGSVGFARVTVDLGDRVADAQPKVENPLDLAVDVDADYLEFRIANDVIHNVQNAPDSQLSIYQDGAKEFSIYAELWKVDSFIYSGGQADNNPCRLEIREFEYNTFWPNRDLLLAYDVKKEHACAEKDGEHEEFILELTDLPTEFRAHTGHIESWRNLGLTLEMNGPLGELRWSRPVVRDDVRFYVALRDVPTGTTDISFIMGKANDIRIQPHQGSVGAVSLGFSSPSKNIGFALELRNVNLVIQNDLDGMKKYKGMPVFSFIDTGGKYLHGWFRVYGDEFGIGAVFNGVRADAVQIYKNKPSWKEIGKSFITGSFDDALEEGLPIKTNGIMDFLYGSDSVKDMKAKIGNKWYKVPNPAELFAQ